MFQAAVDRREDTARNIACCQTCKPFLSFRGDRPGVWDEMSVSPMFSHTLADDQDAPAPILSFGAVAARILAVVRA